MGMFRFLSFNSWLKTNAGFAQSVIGRKSGVSYDKVSYVAKIKTEEGCMLNSTKIGCFIMEKRKSIGLTQQQLADQLNVSFQAVSKWEQGLSSPSTTNLLALAKLYGVSVGELLKSVE